MAPMNSPALVSSQHWRLPADHTSHTHTHTHTHAVMYRRLLKCIRFDRFKGNFVPRSTIPTCVLQHILHTVLRGRLNHKTFILTMALSKDYWHPTKFCNFRAKFVSLGPGVRLALSSSMHPKWTRSSHIDGSGLVSFSDSWKRKMFGSHSVEQVLASASEKLQTFRKLRFLSNGEFFISEFLKLTI